MKSKAKQGQVFKEEDTDQSKAAVSTELRKESPNTSH